MKTFRRWLTTHMLGAGSLLLLSAQSPAPSQGSGLVPRSVAEREQMAAAEHHVTIDVVVSDANGTPVTGLNRRDFSLFDHGSAQNIESFQAVSATRGFRMDGSRAAAGEVEVAPIPVQVMLVLDTLNNSFENVAAERSGIADYLRGSQQPLAYATSLILLSDHGAVVGKPSRDRKMLLNDLKKLPTPIHMIGSAEGYNGSLRRSALSLRSLIQLMTYAGTLQGRKVVIWLGPGWPILAGVSSQTTAKNQRRYFDTLVDLTNGLRKARVTLDALETPGLSRGTELGRDYYKIYLGPVKNASQADSGYLALPVLALKSGGQVMRYSDSIRDSIQTCVSDGDTYYTLSYQAVPSRLPDDYRALEVRVRPPGLTVRTNAAYYAEP